MAGFEVIIYGRFWVIAEDNYAHLLHNQYRSMPRSAS
jgi:hypothetical protein